MANDYGALWARILDELNRTDMTAQVQLEIQSAIRHYERERFWFNEDTTITLASPSVATLALPADLMELDTIHIERNGHPDPPLDAWTWEQYRQIGADDTNIGPSAPSAYSIYANQVYLYPVPDISYTVVFSFLSQETTLSASADTSDWCTWGEELIRQRAKAAFRVNYEHSTAAVAEMTGFALAGESFLSAFERIAYNSLKRKTAKNVSSTIKPMRF